MKKPSLSRRPAAAARGRKTFRVRHNVRAHSSPINRKTREEWKDLYILLRLYQHTCILETATKLYAWPPAAAGQS